MLLLLAGAVLVVTALAERSLLAGGTDKVAPPKRPKMSCATYRSFADNMSKSAGINAKVVPGSWGKLPKELQTLPPGAELCGNVDDVAIVLSPLYGKDLESHYAPLFAKVGCQPLTCDVTAGQTTCTCKGKGIRGRVETSKEMEGLLVTFMRW